MKINPVVIAVAAHQAKRDVPTAFPIQTPSWIASLTLAMTSPQKKQTGFSLLELLVVLVIIGIVITIAMFAFGNTVSNKQIQNAGERLANLIPVVEEQAILEPNIYGLVINVKGYGFEKIVAENGKKKWAAVTDDALLKFQAWPSGTKINLKINTQSGFDIVGPKIIISPSGNLTAFTLQLGDNKPRFLIQASASGAVLQKNL